MSIVFLQKTDVETFVKTPDLTTFQAMVKGASVNGDISHTISIYTSQLEQLAGSGSAPASASGSGSGTSILSLTKFKCPHIVPDPTFFEKQESHGCGRHALNNLLGGTYFIKKDDTVKIDDTTIKTLSLPIPLTNLCKFLTTKIKIPPRKVGDPSCPDNEDYDDVVLTSGLQIIGFKTYSVIDLTDSKTIVKIMAIPQLIGFIKNIGGGHWISYRKVDVDDYLEINSTNTTNPLSNHMTLKEILNIKATSIVGSGALTAVGCTGKFDDHYTDSDALDLTIGGGTRKHSRSRVHAPTRKSSQSSRKTSVSGKV
jgi:hypothetical protein